MLERGLNDPHEEVTIAVRQVFLPVLTLWAAEISMLRSHLIPEFLKACRECLEVRIFIPRAYGKADISLLLNCKPVLLFFRLSSV